MGERLIGVRIAIIRCIDDDSWPSFVECELVDAHGRQHRFHEKSAIVTADLVDSGTQYPYPAVIACQIAGRYYDPGHRDIITVDTELPWHVESTDGKTQFDVLPGDLVEWEFGSDDMRAWSGNA